MPQIITGIRDISEIVLRENEGHNNNVDEDEDEMFEEDLGDLAAEITEAGKRCDVLKQQLKDLEIVPGVYKFEHLPCFAHKCHIIVESSVNDRITCFGRMMKKVWSIVVKYRQSTKAKTILRALYPRTLKGWVRTRYEYPHDFESCVILSKLVPQFSC